MGSSVRECEIEGLCVCVGVCVCVCGCESITHFPYSEKKVKTEELNEVGIC